MLIINFDKNELCKKAYGLWQYDYGQVLRIQGLNLPTAAEIHFALRETGGEAVTRIGITKDGVTDVTIPDSLLEADGASQDYQIYVFIYLATPDSGETTRRITLGVKSRPRPEAFNTPEGEELFEEAIQAVNDAAKRAEDAGKEASAAAGEARESASQAGKYLTDTQALAEQVEINADLVVQGTETARELLAQTQEAASNAALSAEVAKQSETAAKQAQTAAETAEDTARQYAGETEADRREVAENKQSVEQMQSNVARMQTDVRADKEAVEQTVTEFGTAAQNALTAIGQAQNTAVSAVTEEGQKQATAVQETGAQAVNEVDAAKTAAVGAVAEEGDVQVGRVQDAAAEIVADREQIQQNKTDIATLTDKTNTLAPGIVLNAKGGVIAVHNASEQPLVGLNVYGKSTQASEPSIENPQEIVSAGDAGKVNVNIGSKNVLPYEMMLTGTQDGLTLEYLEDEQCFVLNGTTERTKSYFFTYVNLPGVIGNYYSLSMLSLGGEVTKPEGVNIYSTFYIGESNSINNNNNWLNVELYDDCDNRSTLLEKSYISAMWLYVTAGVTYNNYKFRVQLEEGKVASPWEPYKKQTLTLATSNGLAGIPVKSGGNYVDETGQQWITDEIDLEKEERIQRIGECVFDGSEDWFADYILNQTTKRYRTRISDIIRKKQPNEALCSHFSFAGYGDDRIGFFLTSNNADFYLKTMFETVDELKKWLSNNNITVKYILKTPIRTPFTPEEIAAYKTLHTYSPNTTVTNDGGCGMSVEYVADTKAYIKAVEDKITAIQAALINQNISGGV